MNRSKQPSLLRGMALALCLAAVAAMARAEDEKPADPAPMAKITYDEHVQPIFREHCFSCHSQDTKKSDLSLASYTALMTGGASGAIVEPGDIDSSRLWALVSHAEEPNMPPEQDKLPQAKLETVKAWILGGSLENNGSVAKVSKKPKMQMSMASGAAKPEGPPPMPDKLPRQPVIYTPRAAP